MKTLWNFLRHAPCMRHVKKDYEVCAARYQSTMAKIGQSVATTTTTTVASSAYPTMATHPAAVLSGGSGGQYHNGDMSQHQHHHHRQQHEHPARSHPNSTKSIEDAEEERLKTVCCAFQKYMQCSEFTVRHACGDETALFTRKFLDKMSNTLMRLCVCELIPKNKHQSFGWSVTDRFTVQLHSRIDNDVTKDVDRYPIAPGTITTMTMMTIRPATGRCYINIYKPTVARNNGQANAPIAFPPRRGTATG
uniref:Uncharacterized protein n=1 Tax=Anopheles culicifacies TaxID=139723 RepID=A0A182M1N4_9DIPT